jgi:hypothetical protein
MTRIGIGFPRFSRRCALKANDMSTGSDASGSSAGFGALGDRRGVAIVGDQICACSNAPGNDDVVRAA